MPIYEYQCEACGGKLEKLQKISDEPLKNCPACGQPRLTKLISASAFRLKGGGWYETDFKSGSRRNVVEGEKSGTSDTGSGSSESTGGDSKSDAKSDGKSDSNSNSVPVAAG